MGNNNNIEGTIIYNNIVSENTIYIIQGSDININININI